MDVVFIQRNWENAWLDPIAVSGGLTADEKKYLKYEIAKEVEWVTRVDDIDAMTQLRIDKMDLLLTAHENDISAFDSVYLYRRNFFQFILAC